MLYSLTYNGLIGRKPENSSIDMLPLNGANANAVLFLQYCLAHKTYIEPGNP